MATETALNQVKQRDSQDQIRYAVAEVIKKEVNHNKPIDSFTIQQEHITIKQIKTKLEQNKAPIIPADKSNSSVIISNEQLHKKVHH